MRGRNGQGARDASPKRMDSAKQRDADKKYDCFISYNQKADKNLAPAIRNGLQKMAKPWNKRRALKVFLDQSSLSVDPELGVVLDESIGDTRWLVVLMSERSAKSDWCGEEIKEWAEIASRDTVALVLTSGTVVWDPVAKDFDYDRSTAVHPEMTRLYRGQDSEPLYLDLSWTKQQGIEEQDLDLDHAEFRGAIATVAAPIHGKSKDEIEGDDLRQHKRFTRIRRAAVVSLCILTAAAVVGALVARDQRNDAIEQSERAASRAIAGDALNSVSTETDLSALLALESVRVKNTSDARGGLVSLLSEPTRFLQRTAVHDQERITAIAMDEDGRIAVTGDERGMLRIWDVDPDPLAVPQAIPRPTPIDIGAPVADIVVDAIDDWVLLWVWDVDGASILVDLDDPEYIDVVEPPSVYTATAVGTDLDILIGVTEAGDVELSELVFDGEEESFELIDGVSASDWIPVEFGDTIEVAMSVDGSVAAWGTGSSVWIWRIDDGADPTSIAIGSELTSLAVSPDGDVVAIGEETGTLTFASSSEPAGSEAAIPTPTNEVMDLAFMPEQIEDGVWAMTSAHSNGEIRLWNVLAFEGFQPIEDLQDVMLGHTEEAHAVGFGPSGRIASGDFNGEVIWWNNAPLSKLGLSQRAPAGVGDGVTDDIAADDEFTDEFDDEFDDDELEVDESTDDVFTDELDVGSLTAVPADGQAGDMTNAVFFDGDRLVALDGSGRVWQGNSTRDDLVELGEVGGQGESLDGAAGVIAIGRVDGSVDLIARDGTRRTIEGAHQGAVEAVAVSQDGELVFTAADDGAAIWSVADSGPVSTVTLADGFEPTAALFDGGRLWIGGQDADDFAVFVEVDITTGSTDAAVRHNDTPGGNHVNAFALSSDGLVLATGSSDRSIKLWDVGTGASLGSEFVGHRGVVTGLEFWDDDETLISSDDAGSVLMWDVSDRQQFASLGGPSDGVLSLDSDVTTGLLLAASEDDAIWTWTLDQESWRQKACERAGRNMTAAEWGRFGDGDTRIRHCPEFPIDTDDYEDAVYTDELTD